MWCTQCFLHSQVIWLRYFRIGVHPNALIWLLIFNMFHHLIFRSRPAFIFFPTFQVKVSRWLCQFLLRTTLYGLCVHHRTSLDTKLPSVWNCERICQRILQDECHNICQNACQTKCQPGWGQNICQNTCCMKLTRIHVRKNIRTHVRMYINILYYVTWGSSDHMSLCTELMFEYMA